MQRIDLAAGDSTNFDDESYGQRWQVETVMHMLEARLGDALTARSDHARRREMGLMVHLMVVLRRCGEGLYRAVASRLWEWPK